MDDQGKRAAGYHAAELIKPNMRVGIGTGSTVFYFIEALAKRHQTGLKLTAVSSSEQSAQLAKKLGIPLISPQDMTHLDITVDGADEIDPRKQMVKGGGGALLYEKILATSSQEMVVIVDRSKVKQSLGEAKIPVEVMPFGHLATLSKIESLGYCATLRQKDNSPFKTDGGHFIYDLLLKEPLGDAKKMHEALIGIPGVVETGLFFDVAGRVIIGNPNGTVEVWS